MAKDERAQPLRPPARATAARAAQWLRDVCNKEAVDEPPEGEHGTVPSQPCLTADGPPEQRVGPLTHNPATVSVRRDRCKVSGCGKSFKEAGTLKVHMATVHSKERPHE